MTKPVGRLDSSGMRLKDVYAARAAQLAGGFLPLLWLLVLLYVLAPIVDKSTAGSIAVNFFFYTAMLAAVYASVRRRQVFLIALAASALAWLMDAMGQSFEIPAFEIPGKTVAPTLLVLASVAVLGRVLRDERVTLNTVYGAICVYFLIALFWSFVFFLIEEIDQGSFAFPDAGGDRFSDFLYFSVVTQTTLGYGDIIPVSDLPRQLAALQALAGQVFLVVTVARLVALQIAHSGQLEEVGSGARATPRAAASKPPSSDEEPDP